MAVLDKCFDYLPSKNVPNPIQLREAMQTACNDLCRETQPKQLIAQIPESNVVVTWSGNSPSCGLEKIDDQAKRDFSRLSDEDKEKSKNLKGREYAMFMLSKNGHQGFYKKLGIGSESGVQA